jgi:hypothetical protein
MITGEDIHNAFRIVCPRSSLSWRRISKIAKRIYAEMARELNMQFGDDVMTILAVRCRECGEMIDVEHCEGHACWLD